MRIHSGCGDRLSRRWGRPGSDHCRAVGYDTRCEGQGPYSQVGVGGVGAPRDQGQPSLVQTPTETGDRYGGRTSRKGRADWHSSGYPEGSGAGRRLGQVKYTVIYEKGDSTWGAYVPDLPGVIAAGDSREEVEQLIREAVAFHIEGLKAEGVAVPPPASQAGTVEIAAA